MWWAFCPMWARISTCGNKTWHINCDFCFLTWIPDFHMQLAVFTWDLKFHHVQEEEVELYKCQLYFFLSVVIFFYRHRPKIHTWSQTASCTFINVWKEVRVTGWEHSALLQGTSPVLRRRSGTSAATRSHSVDTLSSRSWTGNPPVP